MVAMETPVSDSAAGDVGVQQRRAALMTPALLASCVGIPLIVLAVVLSVAMSIMLRNDPALNAEGVTYLPPSDAERLQIIAGIAVPALIGVGFLVLTWRFRAGGRSVATWACATVVVCMGFVAFW